MLDHLQTLFFRDDGGDDVDCDDGCYGFPKLLLPHQFSLSLDSQSLSYDVFDESDGGDDGDDFR